MKELQRMKRFEMEKEIKDIIERNKIENNKDIEELTQRNNQIKREVDSWKGEIERRLFEIGEDGEDLKNRIEDQVSNIQAEVKCETRKVRESFENFENKNNLKWERTLKEYQDKIENFQSNLLFCLIKNLIKKKKLKIQ